MLNKIKAKLGLGHKENPCASSKKCICVKNAYKAIEYFNYLIEGFDDLMSNPDVNETIHNLVASKNIIELYLNSYQKEPTERNMLLLHKSLELCSEGDRQLNILKKKMQDQINQENNALDS